jgi:DNA topoisomerase I
MPPVLILESRAKCATIQKILNDGTVCVATGGHVRETVGSIDALSAEYMPTFKQVERNLTALKKVIRGATQVYLGMDDDREGEAIAWHLCELYNLPLTTPRVVFHAVTPECIRRAVANPRPIDMSLVQAQLARVTSDLLVGHTVSPMLWKGIGGRGSLSAGRCQTPALGLVLEASQRSDGLVVEHAVNAMFNELPVEFHLHESFTTPIAVEAFLQASIVHDHVFTILPSRDTTTPAPKPLTTSTLQQMASSALGWTPKKTMQVAGDLYSAGHITYPRTDKAEYAPEFVIQATRYINNKFGAAYTRTDTSGSTASSKHAQEAHEAIRCTRLEQEHGMDSPLYKLIRQRTIQSCMASCLQTVFPLRVTAANDNGFRAQHIVTRFCGWKFLCPSHDCTNEDERLLQAAISTSGCGTTLSLDQSESTVRVRGGVQHVKDAGLIKLLEKEGIGRPSTYAGLVDKICTRGYVERRDVPGTLVETTVYTLKPPTLESHPFSETLGTQRNRLVPTELGAKVYDFCIKLLPKLFSVEYTSELEKQLDEVANGVRTRMLVCQEVADTLKTVKPVARTEPQLGYNYCVGKFGPCLRHVDEEGKVSFHKLGKGVTESDVQAATDPTTLISIQQQLGQHEGKPVLFKEGQYGPYVEWNGQRISWKEETLPTVTTAMTAIKGKSTQCIRKLEGGWDIRRGVKGRPDYAQKTGPKRSKPQRIGLSKYPGDYTNDPVCDVVAWITSGGNV